MKFTIPLFFLLFSSTMFADNSWRHSFSLGFNVAKGNNDTTQLNAKLDGNKKGEDSKLSYGLSANSGEDQDQQITNNYGAKVQYDKNYSAKAYWLITASLDIDKIADLDRRVYLGPGLGYNIIKKDNATFDFELGIAYLETKYDGVSGESDLGYRIAEIYTRQLSENANLWQSTEFLGNGGESDAYVIKAELGVETSIVGGFNIKSYIQDTYNNQPARGKKKNDFAFVTMLVYKF
jgi:putative salt-induced outer membrane protein YdiY